MSPPGRARTESQLETEFPDNFVKEITAQDSRDLIRSAFGYVTGAPPTVNNDNVDTAGIGAFFDTGSRWFEMARGREWYCVTGAPGAALWRAIMYDGETAGGVLSGTYPNPGGSSGSSGPVAGTVGWFLGGAGPLSGLPTIGVYTLQDGETGLASGRSITKENGPWTVHTGAWTRPTWYATGTVFNTYVIVNVISGEDNAVDGFSPCLFQGSPYAIGDSFTPWVVDTDGTSWAPAGTGNFQLVAGAGIHISPVNPVPTNDASNVAVALLPTVPADVVAFTPVANPGVPNTLYVDSTTLDLTINNNANVPFTLLIAGGPGSLMFAKFNVSFTQLNSPTISPMRVNLGGIPAGVSVLQILAKVTTAWTKTGGTPLSLTTIEYGLPTNDGFFATQAATGWQTPTDTLYGFTNQGGGTWGGGSPAFTAGFTFRITFQVSPTGETPTGGTATIWLVLIPLP